MNKLALSAMGLALAVSGAAASAQDAPPPRPAGQPQAGPPPGAPPAGARNPFQGEPLGDGPWDVLTSDAKLHVEVVTKDLDHPWGMAFLPDGGMLVTERPGRLRLVRDGVLDPKPIEGLPAMITQGIAGLTDIVLDPDFATNTGIKGGDHFHMHCIADPLSPDHFEGRVSNEGRASAEVLPEVRMTMRRFGRL